MQDYFRNVRDYLRGIERAIFQLIVFNRRLEKISQRFEEVWNFFHAIESIDGKYIRIEYSKVTGTLYHNYKGSLSMVLYVTLRTALHSLISVITGVTMTVVF